MGRWTWALVALGGCGGHDDTGAGGVDYAANPLAGDVVIDSVRVNQGSERVLYLGPGVAGGGVRPPPIVAGRDAEVTIELSGLDEDQVVERDVAVVLGVQTSEVSQVVTQVAHVAKVESVFSDRPAVRFPLPGSVMVPDLELTVELHEVGATSPGTYTDEDTWSSADAGPLDVRASESIELHVLPIQLGSSPLMPDTSAQRLLEIQQQMLAMYPASAVDVVLEPSIEWPSPVTPFNGWEELLNQVSQLRTAQPLPANAYYYGTFVGTKTVDEWCAQGCILGLSLLPPTATDDWAKASIGVGYADGTVMVDTLVHEVGHAHGREHAPCGDGLTGVDAAYPYGGATIGVTGYDWTRQEEHDATGTYDMMSYCAPIWLSDYTYGALFDRIVAAGQARASTRRSDWRLLRVAADGATEPVATVQASAPTSAPRAFDVLDDDGRAVGEVQGVYAPYDHVPGGLALVPPDAPEHLRLR